MQLDDNYRIVRDARSWNLVSSRNRNDTPYHPNLKQALLAYLHICVTPPITVLHVLKAISDAERNIENMVSRLRLESSATPDGTEDRTNGQK